MKNFKEYLSEGERREKRIQASYSKKQRELSDLNRGDHSSVPKDTESSNFLFPEMDKDVNLRHMDRVNARKNELATDILSLNTALSSAKGKNERRMQAKERQILNNFKTGKAQTFPPRFVSQMLPPKAQTGNTQQFYNPEPYVKTDIYGFVKDPFGKDWED
jgi:hypothetical protein